MARRGENGGKEVRRGSERMERKGMEGRGGEEIRVPDGKN